MRNERQIIRKEGREYLSWKGIMSWLLQRITTGEDEAKRE
jgi:hypothetical protein